MPGFNSSPLSEKSKLLTAQFPGIVIPDYNSWDPEISYAQLTHCIEPLLSEKLLLTGSSLGGFWAYHLASQYKLPCLLINPCMSPEISLQRYVGPVENFYTHETGLLTKHHLAQYQRFRFPGKPRYITVLHEQGDELIPYQESVKNFVGKAKLLLPGAGNHRFARTDLLLENIRLMTRRF